MSYRPRDMPVETWLLENRVVTSSGCWEWTRARLPTGYGYVSMPRTREVRGVHRVAHELWIGPIPPGAHVMHRCDNPPCFNPAHLIAGTTTANQRDSGRKGRNRRPRARLTPTAALTIARSDRPTGELAREYRVDTKTIWRVRHGVSWSEVTGIRPPS